ncbi:hypothetical protein AZE42_08473 [Rhizopogon vesiculosus]|uniref:SnoaL-like domain-containing protein n=1 Tax=Rhizopogon vesiculosus TaxID=180088 RepID=A0A1J8Q568_9AGAM|nr:hypothetical protein AZE42_08473 [Rhizopogon vesiculosus]
MSTSPLETSTAHVISCQRSDSASPTMTYHHSIIPIPLPIPDLVNSAAGGAHYSGAPVSDSDNGLVASPVSGEPSPSLQGDETIRDCIMADLKELYCCRPTKEIFERIWRPDAVFEDPSVKCEGYTEYAAQWFAMPKIFSESETISSRVMSFTRCPRRLVYAQTQEYTLRFLGTKKLIDSIIVVELDDDYKIIRMTDQWNGKQLRSWFGPNLLRRAKAVVTPWLIRAPKA